MFMMALKTKRSLRKYKIFIPLLSFLLSLWSPYNVEPFEREDILGWVAGKLKITPGEDRPRVIELEEEELKEQFLLSADKQLKSLRESLGKAGWNMQDSDHYINGIVNDVVGFFAKTTSTIYLKKSLESCYKDSILAHEITHFFQVKYNLFPEELRELQAVSLEMKYREEHCENP